MKDTAESGVFLCRCFSAPPDPSLTDRIARRWNSLHPGRKAEVCEGGCTAKGLADIVERVRTEGFRRVLIGSCSPALHRPLFSQALSGGDVERVEVVDLYGRNVSPHEEEGLANLEAGLNALKSLPGPAVDRGFVSRALVVGGGVAGIQASLDIANAGFPVVLVEKESSIGGHMLQLSEVFPTLDCPQCIMTPKMVEVAQHDHIDLRACTEVESVDGEVGRFRVKLRRKATYIDWDKCTGCGECASVCPVEVYSDWDRGIASTKATSRPFAQAVPNKFKITKNGMSPCRAACPATCNAHGYVALIASRKWKEAYSLITETIPFPGIVGRVCPHPCETACHRGSVDSPVSICSLKRFVADQVRGDEPELSPGPDQGRTVAVVGAGPAGLTSALVLRMKGIGVTVYEGTDRIGGMTAWGIPSYRLPRSILAEELSLPLRLGAEVRLNQKLGTDFTLDDLRREHDAVILALGAWKSWKLGLPGEELDGVEGALSFLARVNGGEPSAVPDRVTVIGGGNTAFDAARSAVRMGASRVSIVYRRSQDEMPANPDEIEGARAEGIHIEFLATPKSVLGEDGKVEAVEFIRNELGPPDRTGRRRPVALPGSEFQVETDLCIAAIGQVPDADFLEEDPRLEFLKSGALRADGLTLETGLGGVFAAGDFVTGPDTVVGAIAGGRRAAESAIRFVEGADLREGREPPHTPVAERPDRPPTVTRARARMEEVPAEERVGGFDAFEKGFTEEQAVGEAERCLNCADCCECLTCVAACEPKAIDHSMTDRIEEVEAGAVVMATGYDLLPVGNLKEYDRDPDVIDAMQFERLLCPSGPTDGMVYRPSNGAVPRDVIIVACAGSRDPEHHKPYCSRVCCLYSTKLAMLYRHAVHGGNVHFFYIDVRTDGKMYEEFYQRAQEEEGVHYIKGRVSRIYRREDRLVVTGADMLSGRAVTAEADMVVLAMAMIPSPAGVDLGGRMGLTMDEHGFFQEEHGLLMPIDGSREGVFYAGTCQGPKDIPECVAHASGTAGRVLSLFGSRRKDRRESAAGIFEAEAVESK